MKEYKINEIFYSLQGEGVNAGTPAIFIRFSGCNLKCPFCDTDHSSGAFMTAEEIIGEVGMLPCKKVVLTGGEPSLFVDQQLIDRLHAVGYKIAIETNGTQNLPKGIDHVTLSPKDEFNSGTELKVKQCDELKVVYTGANDPAKYDYINTSRRMLQPCDTGNDELNHRLTAEAIEYCMRNPEWRLSLQLHKILNIR